LVELWTEENLARYGDLFINGDEPKLIVEKINLDEASESDLDEEKLIFKHSNNSLHSLTKFLPGCQSIRKLEINLSSERDMPVYANFKNLQ